MKDIKMKKNVSYLLIENLMKKLKNRVVWLIVASMKKLIGVGLVVEKYNFIR